MPILCSATGRNIISKLFISKRWKKNWTLVPTLISYHDDDKYSWSDFVLFVDKTLTQCRQLKLKKFVLYTHCDIQSGSQIHNWIHYATRCNVEELNIKLWSLWSVENEFSLDESFFINTCLIDLTLSGCIFNPIGSIHWKNLRSLCIAHATLDEVLIEILISGSPLLETLIMDFCLGYRRLDITSKSVKNLVLSNCYGYRAIDNIEIKAPNILSLTIKGCLILGKLLLVTMSSLVEASLDYKKTCHYETTLKEVEEEMLREFISNLRHVKELKIGVLSRLEEKGFISPSNIKCPDVFVNEWSLAMLNNGPKGDEVN